MSKEATRVKSLEEIRKGVERREWKEENCRGKGDVERRKKLGEKGEKEVWRKN